jgi:hypothetical protein
VVNCAEKNTWAALDTAITKNNPRAPNINPGMGLKIMPTKNNGIQITRKAMNRIKPRFNRCNKRMVRNEILRRISKNH